MTGTACSEDNTFGRLRAADFFSPSGDGDRNAERMLR
jgi:hypothetical protein